MKKIMGKNWFIVIALMVFTAGAQDLIKNGNFAELLQNWEIWPKKLHPEAEVKLDNTISRSVGRSLRITHKRDDLYSRIQQLDVPCKPHTDYIASFYAKGKEIRSYKGGGARMFIGPNGGLDRAIISFGPGIEYHKLNPKPESWDFDWTYYESPVFNSGINTKLGITLYLANAGGTVWFDNIELMEYTPELQREREAGMARKLLDGDIKALTAAAAHNPTVLAKLRKKSEELEVWYPETPDPKQGVPLYRFQREILALNADLLRDKFSDATLITSQAAPLKPQCYLSGARELKPVDSDIVISGVCGDSEAFALNFTNCTPETLTVRLIPDGRLDMEIRMVTDIATDAGRFVDDALIRMKPDAEGVYPFEIPGGVTRQIYFSVKLPMKKGITESFLRWNWGNESSTLTLKQHTFNVKFPMEMPLRTFSYSYLYAHGLNQNTEASIRRLRSMHQNACQLYQFDSPQPVYDENGILLPEKMDWNKIDQNRQLMVQPGMIILYLPVHSNPHLKIFLGKSMAPFSDEWNSRVSQYLKAVTAGLKERGLGYDRFLISLRDEPGENEVDYMEKLATLIRKTDPRLRIYNNFHYALSLPAIKRLTAAVDVIAPEVHMITPDRMEILKDSGKEIWCYWVQNKGIPGSDIRDLFLKLELENFTGFSYWCFRDCNSVWRPGQMQSYSVVYDGDPAEWIPSKRCEGIREGIEDYTLLHMLKTRNPGIYRNLNSKLTSQNWPQLRRKILSALED